MIRTHARLVPLVLAALALLAPAPAARAESDDERNVRSYTKRAKEGDAEAQRTLGALYMNGQWVEQDSKKAFPWFLAAAKQGDMESQALVGQMLETGDGAAADPKKAHGWYRKAGEQGDATAAYNAGRLHLEEGETAEATTWFRRSADAGLPEAKTALDSLKGGATLAKVSPKEQIEIYEDDAKQGDVDAQLALGLLYLHGEGETRDTGKGIDYLEEAAEQGNAEAQATLGMVYDQGIGVRPDAKRAVEWYERAAAGGHAKARFNLAVIYRHAQGVPTNLDRAIMWLVLARDQDYSARYMLHDLEGQLSEEELRPGREMAENWRPPAGR